MTDAFYVPEGDGFRPTGWTRGPWDAGAQHAGPPAALLGRAIEGLEPVGRFQVARFTLEILRPIPLAPLRIDARLSRPGRRVQLAEASLTDERGEVARASAWRILRADSPLPSAGQEEPPFDGPLESPPMPMDASPWQGENYFNAIEWRQAAGGFFDPGPAAAWMRMRVPLVAGEEPSALARVLVAADSGNGLSFVTPPLEYLFINTS